MMLLTLPVFFLWESLHIGLCVVNLLLPFGFQLEVFWFCLNCSLLLVDANWKSSGFNWGLWFASWIAEFQVDPINFPSNYVNFDSDLSLLMI